MIDIVLVPMPTQAGLQKLAEQNRRALRVIQGGQS